MTAITATFTSLPFTQLRRNRFFYLYYDGFYVLACIALLAAMRLGHHQPFVQHWSPRLFLLLPLVCYAQVLSSVFIHNATHNSFPRPINRLVGELCGIIVLTRFASWEVVHQRHHRYADDVEKDPHPIVTGYWRYVAQTLVSVERQLQRIYFDLYGETPSTRRYERRRAIASYATNLLLLYTWYSFLGPIAFFFFFVPSALLGMLHIIHFNWSTHNAASRAKDFHPVNLNHGLFKLGNKLLFGIYMHANHHKRANVFNPAKMLPSLPLTPPVART